MIQISDHILAIHNDRQRSLEATARQAALASHARRNDRKARRSILRRMASARRRTSTSTTTAPSP